MVRLVKQQVCIFTLQKTPKRIKGRPVRKSRDLKSLTSKKGLEKSGLFSLEEIWGKCSGLLQSGGEQAVLQLHAEKHRKEWA